MQIELATPLLGGMSPAQFMRRHWQKKPLCVRQAVPGVRPPLDRAALFALAARTSVTCSARRSAMPASGWLPSSTT
jgi:50S ribosomal protein L16 3-hydroxylase